LPYGKYGQVEKEIINKKLVYARAREENGIMFDLPEFTKEQIQDAKRLYTLSYSIEQGCWHIEELGEQIIRGKEFFAKGQQDHYSLLHIGNYLELQALAEKLKPILTDAHEKLGLS
jgi:hypothetical protein